MEVLNLPSNAKAKLGLRTINFYQPNISGLKKGNPQKASQDEPCTQGNKPPKPQKKYKINKREIRKRLAVLFETRQFRKCTKFWSVSFPPYIPIDDRYRMLNIFLTRCRKDWDLKHYLWVAEYQQSGSLHFHIVTNLWCSAKELNNMWRASIKNFAKSTGNTYELDKAGRYNGFDISKKRSGKKQIAKYVTKYVTKNNSEFERLAWYCSESISNLCTGVEVSQEYLFSQFDKEFIKTKHSFIFEGDYFVHLSFNNILFCTATHEIMRYNQDILNTFEEVLN